MLSPTGIRHAKLYREVFWQSLQFLERNPLVARSPGTRGGFLSRKSQNLKMFRLRRVFLINFEYSLLSETRILMISSCAKTCFPDSSDVFSSVRARLYHSQAAQTCSGCFLECKNAPLPFAKRKNTVYADGFPHVFTSVGTRFYHSQKLAYLQIAEIMWFLLFPRVYGRVSTIRKTTECVQVA